MVSPREIKKEGREERKRERGGKETQEEEDEEGFLETASIFKLARLCAGARRGWQGSERRERGCSSDPFRICPIENLSDVHSVSSSRHFYRRARVRVVLSRFIPPFLLVFVRLFFKGASFFLLIPPLPADTRSFSFVFAPFVPSI